MIDNYITFKGNNPFGTQAKMLFHIDRIYEYMATGDTRPIEMEINLTNRCNMKCEWCINANFRNDEDIGIDSLMDFFKVFKTLGGKSLVFSGGGEPTLYSYLEEATRAAFDEGFELGLMTNGIYPVQYNQFIGSHFTWMRFSLDTIDSETYKKWKGVNKVSRAIDNIVDLINYPVKVGVNCNISPWHTVEDIKSFLWIRNCIDYIQFRPVLPRYFCKEQPNINKKLWDYLLKMKDNAFINLSNDKLQDIMSSNFFPFTSCEGHHFIPILNANGDVCVCMYHPNDKRFVFGNIYEDDFKTIWESDRRKEVIEFVRKLDYKKECQICCKLTETNKFLDYIKHPERATDINFP